MALRRRFRPVFLKHAPRGMARFAKPLQGPFGLAAKHSQKHKNRPKIGRFSHFNPSAEMHPFSPFSASKAPEKWLCDAICRKKQLFPTSRSGFLILHECLHRHIAITIPNEVWGSALCKGNKNAPSRPNGNGPVRVAAPGRISSLCRQRAQFGLQRCPQRRIVLIQGIFPIEVFQP